MIRSKLYLLVVLFISCFVQAELFAQQDFRIDTNLIHSSGNFPKKLNQNLGNISVGGYYRFIGNYSDMKIPYPEFVGGARKKIFIGDDSQIPQLMLQISGRPNANTSFSTDIYFWTPLTGSQKDYAKGLNLGVNLTGSHSNKYGTFNIRTGGIHWYSLSPMTFGANTGYNRYSLFERNPWDPATDNVQDRYSNFYKNGALTQDVRWGQQAFHGFIFDGVKLPKQMSFAFMYGKTQFNGGAIAIPNSSIGGKIRKNFGSDFIGLNTFTSQTFTDSLTTRKVRFEIYTTQFLFEKNGYKIDGEIGTGRYYSPTTSNKWGEAINIKFKVPKKFTLIPLEFHVYQISPKVINNNGVFWNTSIVEYNGNAANTGAGSQTVLFPFASSMLQLGQMTNNRRGFEFNGDVIIKKLKVSFGYGMSSEMSALTNTLSFSHPANNLALSRFWRWGFPPGVGPYGTINKIFRGVYETTQVTDSLPTKKGFNTIEISAKYNAKLFGKELFINYLGFFSSVESSFSPIPRYSQKAYLQTYFNQIELYYKLNDKLIWTNYFGIDRIIGNNHTTLDVTSHLAKNQTGYSIATGFDYSLSKNAGLYFRQRWFNNKDKNFANDKYQGLESTVEIKIFF